MESSCQMETLRFSWQNASCSCKQTIATGRMLTLMGKTLLMAIPAALRHELPACCTCEYKVSQVALAMNKACATKDTIQAVMQGFILDGFPRSVSQAMALEKAITNLDLPAELEYAAGSSTIAPPAPDTFRSPTRPLKSCLDSVVMLELEDTEAAVSRAVGRRMDPTTGTIYHMDLSPPPGDVPGLLERLQPVKSLSNDTEQLQKRLQVLASR